jgi:hypothetical protein
MMRKILVMGLPGAGKTTLSKNLARRLNAVHFNADEVRTEVNKDLGFSLPDRIEHARRLGWLCDQVVRTGTYVIADFICPTPETRAAFGPAFVVWLDRVQRSRYADTDQIFVAPSPVNVRVTVEGDPEFWVEKIVHQLRPAFDPKKATALFVGRWQPFHDGHRALIEEGLRRIGQVCIAVRDTQGTDVRNPLSFEQVKQRIQDALYVHNGRFIIVPVPNITHVFYGRDVGYVVERLTLADTIESISATDLRRRLRMNQ